MDIDVEDFSWMLTIKPHVEIDGVSTVIPFEIHFSEDNRVEVLIDWAEWNVLMGISPTEELAHLPPAGKVREAAFHAAEYLAASANERLSAVAAPLRDYGEKYTTTIGRVERGGQLG